MNMTHTHEALADSIRETLANRLRLPLDAVTLHTRFDRLQMDSLDLAELFFLLEEQLGTTIPMSQGVELASVSDVVDLVWRHLQQAPFNMHAAGE